MPQTGHMQEATRRPGSEWLKDHPNILSRLYTGTKVAFEAAYPLMKRISPDLTERVVLWNEEVFKGYLFNCQMCGQCILHSTGMTCPMTCPKLLRNGPCGGVRPAGYCEVYPERRCVWTDAYERSRKMPHFGEAILDVQPPVDWTLEGTSAWINMLTNSMDREGFLQRNLPDQPDAGT